MSYRVLELFCRKLPAGENVRISVYRGRGRDKKKVGGWEASPDPELRDAEIQDHVENLEGDYLEAFQGSNYLTCCTLPPLDSSPGKRSKKRKMRKKLMKALMNDEPMDTKHILVELLDDEDD